MQQPQGQPVYRPTVPMMVAQPSYTLPKPSAPTYTPSSPQRQKDFRKAFESLVDEKAKQLRKERGLNAVKSRIPDIIRRMGSRADHPHVAEAMYFSPEQTQSTLTVVGLAPTETRTVLIQHREKQLATKAIVKPGQASAQRVVLRKGAVVRGRFVDDTGDPVQTQIEATTILIRNAARVGETSSDENGNFVLSALPQDLDVEFRLPSSKYRLPEKARERKTSDGTIDLGTLVVNGSGSLASVAKKPATEPTDTVVVGVLPTQEPQRSKPEANQAMPISLTYSGKVLNEDRSAAADAYVAVIARELDGQLWRDPQVLAETTTDADGGYEIRLDGVSTTTHVNPHVVMRSEDSAIAWKKLDLHHADKNATGVIHVGETKLVPAETIQCRLVDLEGRPAANLEIQFNSVIVPKAGKERSPGVGFTLKQNPPKAWIQNMRTDHDGLLTIPNIPSGHGVYVSVLATDEFAPQRIALNTGMSEKRGERDGTYRSIVKNMKPGKVASIPLSPATIFEGVVRLTDTGKPAANCKIEIWARQEGSGSMSGVFDTTDDQGRFRLNPNPGAYFGITAHPPEGTAYQIKQLGGFEGFRWKSGDESKNITIELSKGVVATGQVVDAKTGEPIANAAVEYRPMATNPNDAGDIITGWQGIKKTNEQGEFRISTLPGEGWLLVHTNNRDYVLTQKTGRQLAYGKPGGQRIYAHAITKINPTKSEVNAGQLKLTPAKSVTLEVVDPQGNPVPEGLAISRLHVRVHSGWWRGQSPDKIVNGRVEIGGLGDDEECPIYLLDPKRKLGAIATINAEKSTQKVTLQPCGPAVRRYVDAEGNPLDGKGMPLHMVVTPGAHRLEIKAMDQGAVAADQDFVSNIDRLNHWDNLSGEDGRLVLPALIPGATYLYPTGEERKHTELVVKSAEVRDLGKVVVDEDDES